MDLGPDGSVLTGCNGFVRIGGMSRFSFSIGRIHRSWANSFDLGDVLIHVFLLEPLLQDSESLLGTFSI